MAIKKLQISDVIKKHLKIIAYLVVSAIIAYGISLVAEKQEYLYFAPVINYILYAIEKELKNEGYIKAVRG